MKFEDLGLAEPLVRSVRAQGYHTVTPIQMKAIPKILDGHDLMGCAQTGTGKTAAFALPTLQHLSNGAGQGRRKGNAKGRAPRRPIRSLILAPTRELAVQIGVSFRVYGKFTGLRHTVVYGGVSAGTTGMWGGANTAREEPFQRAKFNCRLLMAKQAGRGRIERFNRLLGPI